MSKLKAILSKLPLSGIILFMLFVAPVAAICGQIRVRLECDDCDMNYLRENLNYIEFVRDIGDADVYIKIFSEDITEGAEAVTIDFNGRKRFTGKSDTLRYGVNQNDTDEESRGKMLKCLHIGLLRYVALEKDCDKIELSITNNAPIESIEDDPWKRWILSISSSFYASGEASSDYFNLYNSFYAGKITETIKTGIEFNVNYSENQYAMYVRQAPDTIKRYNIVNISRSYYGNMYYIFPLMKDWALGFSWDFYSSIYDNINFSSSIAGGVEYSFFPYEDYNRRQCRLQLKFEPHFRDYYERTIYDKERETFTESNAQFYMKYIESWGSVYGSLNAGTRVDDLEKTHLRLSGGASVRIIKGLSLDLSGSYSSIHNLTSLSGANSDMDDILLKRRQQATDYSYWTNVGLSYTFGSMFQHDPNPRFN